MEKVPQDQILWKTNFDGDKIVYTDQIKWLHAKTRRYSSSTAPNCRGKHIKEFHSTKN